MAPDLDHGIRRTRSLPDVALVLFAVMSSLSDRVVGEEPVPDLRTVPMELRTSDRPASPVIPVGAADTLDLDGALNEDAWRRAIAYTHLERNDGQGALDFPTAVKFVQRGNELWIGVDATIPRAKDGRDLAPALAQERLELWLDNAYNRHSAFQIFLHPVTGTVEMPGFSPAETAAAVSAAVVARSDGYSAEIRLRRDAFTALGEPNQSWVGFNLARDCAGGRWATLAGFVGQPQRPHAFWTLDLSGTRTRRDPTSAYAHPPFVRDDPRAMARGLIAAWDAFPERDDPAIGRMHVLIARLRALLDADQADAWGFDDRIGLVLWMAQRRAAALPAADAGWNAAVRRLTDALAPGSPVPATSWSEEAYRSGADGTWQPYALRVPDDQIAGETYPLIIYLHGSGQGHAGEGAVFDRWAAPSRCFVAQPCARRCDVYRSLAIRDVRDVIADVRRRFAIDPDRLYLYGYSAGAFATLRMASDAPQDFVAVANLAGDLPAGEEDNLSGLPVLVVHGLSDPNVPFAGGMAMNLLTWRRTGAMVTDRVLPRTGHGTPLSGVEEWLLRHQPAPTPTAVTCRTTVRDPRPTRAYWATITDLVFADQQAAVSARIDGDELHAITANASACAFTLSALPNRIVTIVIDGQRLTAPATPCVELHNGAAGWVVSGCAASPTPDPAAYAPGGVDSVFRDGPVLIVYGDGFADAAKGLASFSPDGWNPTVHWPIKAAAAVVASDLVDNNLILLGGADRNPVSAEVAKRIWLLPTIESGRTVAVPMQGEPDPKPIAGVTAFAADRYAFSLVTRNPFAPARRIWVLATPDSAMISRRSNLMRSWWPDGSPDLIAIECATGALVQQWSLADGWRPQLIWR